MEQKTNGHLVAAHKELLAFYNAADGQDFIMADAVKTLELIHNVLAGIKKRQDEQQVIMPAILG